MPTVPLPWLGGLERDKGAMVGDPTHFADIRNVLPGRATHRLRGGFGDAIATIAGEVAICHIDVFRTAGRVIVVAVDAGLDVNVYEVDVQGQNATLVGTMGTLTPDAGYPPRFSSAESFGVFLLAHDEPDVTERLETYAYDPVAMTPWAVVEADLDGLGDAPVQFRGVREHYGYIFGWGYGSASDPDRPETVRVSAADDPTTFAANHYLVVGTRSEPVLDCRAVGASLAVLKAASWHRIDGSDRATWAQALVDPETGAVASRGSINLYGALYWWSPFGPRTSGGVGTQDPGQPLDLAGNAPADLPVAGAADDCWAFLVPEETLLCWAFPNYADDTTLIYALSLREPSNPRWVWWTVAFALPCGALVTAGAATVTLPPGYADNVVVAGAVGAATATADVTWDNVDCVGDELVEVWYQMNAGAWQLGTTVAVNTSGPQSVTLSGGALASGTINVAIRHRRLNRYRTGYEDAADPSLWPPDSLGTGTIVVVAVPSGVAVAYDFTDGSVDVTWTNGDAGQDIDVELALTDGSGPATASPVAGTTTQPFAWGVGAPQNLARLNGLTPDPFLASGIQARVRHKVGAILGAWSAWSAAVAITYNGALDGAAAQHYDPAEKTSVSLGTAFGIQIDRPSSQVGTLSVAAAVLDNASTVGFGAIPANGSCGTTTDFGGGFVAFPPGAGYALVIPSLSTSDPVITTYTFPAPACGTCQVVGQRVAMGRASVVLGWTKAGHFAEHGALFTFLLPGGGGDLRTCGP